MYKEKREDSESAASRFSIIDNDNYKSPGFPK